jgi:predicted Zn-dependent protease with MMP-like domain
MTSSRWEKLKARAQVVVERTMAELPPDILAEAQKVPVLFQEVCEEDPEILGTYGYFEPGEVSPANGPIILYLETIEDFCADESEDFEAEVRLTYLHELGHHLGWDEDDLEARGLG